MLAVACTGTCERLRGGREAKVSYYNRAYCLLYGHVCVVCVDMYVWCVWTCMCGVCGHVCVVCVDMYITIIFVKFLSVGFGSGCIQ